LEFRTSSYTRGLIALVAAGLLLVGAILLLLQMVGRVFSPLVFWLGVACLIDLLLLMIVSYWAVATLGLLYRLDRNGVVISWGASRNRVPMENIQDIVPGTYLSEQMSRPNTALGRSMGCWWRRLRLPNGKLVYMRTSLPLAQSIALITPSCAYVISPRQPRSFVEGWQARRPLGPTQIWREEEQRSWILGLPIWTDRVAWALVAGAVMMALVSFGYLASIYDHLPAEVPLHFDSFGQPDRSGPPSEVLHLPLVALGLLAADLGLGFVLYRNERMAAYLMWGGGLLLQLLAWGALFTVTT
jgi:hypothetical protein